MSRRATLLRTLLLLATVVLIVSAVLGTVLGVCAGYSRWVDGYVAGGGVWWALHQAIALMLGCVAGGVVWWGLTRALAIIVRD